MSRLVLGFSFLGAFAFSLGAAEPAPAPWKPFDLGTHHRAVSTKSSEAQKAFDQGLTWAFAFNHDERIAS